jgi:DNA repair exonuclease SbcCD ATPase subunit
MAESDGLKKLTEYLNQTRRQAEGAIDVLNEKISELENENNILVKMVDRLEGERDHFKEYSEKLKNEHAIKWKLQERDEWRSLVDSVQKDRSRLQDLCNNLELELEQSKEETELLRNENAQLIEQHQQYTQQAQQKSTELSLATPEKRRSNSVDLRIACEEHDTTDESTSPQNSPIFDRSGKEMTYLQAETPRVIARTLKAELKRAHTQV